GIELRTTPRSRPPERTTQNNSRRGSSSALTPLNLIDPEREYLRSNFGFPINWKLCSSMSRTTTSPLVVIDEMERTGEAGLVPAGDSCYRTPARRGGRLLVYPV